VIFIHAVEVDHGLASPFVGPDPLEGDQLINLSLSEFAIPATVLEFDDSAISEAPAEAKLQILRVGRSNYFQCNIATTTAKLAVVLSWLKQEFDPARERPNFQ
jgi:hypothetical protein